MKSAKEKTNVMRLLDAKKVPYQSHCYLDSGAISGEEVARALGEDPARVFKTLVTLGASGAHYVFVVPVDRELDLKKAAKAAGEKSVAMLKAKELLALTGYVHGGCSPIGMKKPFPTFFDASARNFEKICFSAGKIGYQVELAPADLEGVLRFAWSDLVKD